VPAPPPPADASLSLWTLPTPRHLGQRNAAQDESIH
jgi:hypothetical protein